MPLTAPRFQVVNVEFSNGATASFTMVAQTQRICERQTRLHFAYGELIGDMDTFTVTNFRTRKTTHHVPANEGGGHGGGDNSPLGVGWEMHDYYRPGALKNGIAHDAAATSPGDESGSEKNLTNNPEPARRTKGAIRVDTVWTMTRD